ncbi:hypothetical protein QYE76_057178 [Lolium multiflorum]|uniref:Reverse transcriptase domain-containing protein n=1 Tax=Lolium multiflorum TaxID=4521 RepID=A0AAD8T3M6_LOLMU|nr:hypothetical protein QYE76_057178 [Lolium multiflorum]
MPPWERFRDLCLQRFGPTLRGSRLTELGRLAFTTTVQDFADRFQALACHAPGVSARQRADLFVGGLPDYIRVDVEMRGLRATWQRSSRAPDRPNAHRPAAPAPAAAPAGPPAPTRPFKRRRAEQLERRRQGLCFNCDEIRAGPHVRPPLSTLETVDDTDVEALTAELAAATITEAGVTTYAPIDASAFVVSLHAMAGIKTAKTMLLPVTINGERLTALVDTGSTHNFMSNTAMRRLALQPAGSEKYSVTVANGDRLTCQGVARQVPVLVGDEPFSIDCVGIDLGCYDFILGLDFLSTLGPIPWDLDVLTLIFWREGGRRVHWTGLGSTGASPQLHLMAAALDEAHPLLADLLQQPAASLAALRPPHTPAAEHGARRCAAVPGIIRISTSPFSAPVLLVRKADGTWRFCIGFRALNTVTSKDKFPIPVVDELLDELHGARFFTKLDLRSGYHQVRMHPDDIAKTAFRTHHGHYEFLVMPFGLSNSPATFQALMNDVLSPYLRRFVLVFFDDILIYSASWAEHLQNVSIIFNELRAHRLHLKRSKCSFGTTSVAYLGQVISADGVAMDADKVAAVAAGRRPPRALRGFLGLAEYYRRYIQDFGLIAAPLTRSFAATPSPGTRGGHGAVALRRALTTGPVLQMRTSTSRLWWTATPPASASAPSFTRARGPRFLQPPLRRAPPQARRI